MPLIIENRGSGFIGEIGEGWRISQNASPMVVGESAGRLGSLTFSARCDGTSKFTIDNYLSVKHFADNQTDRWLSTFDGHIRSVETDGEFGQFTMASFLSALDVERTSSLDVSGTYQRGIIIPTGVEYVIGATTYTIGGHWEVIDGENTFVTVPTQVWDVAIGRNYTWVLCSGGHNGEVVAKFGIDGFFYGVWPVYSDATDLAGPGSRYITQEDTYLWIGQVNADRVKRFDIDGVFLTQWGSAGSGDGQFGTISGIATSEGFNAIYVTDSALGRVQCFTDTGTFQFKWGTLGTGPGAAVFNAPNGVSVDPITGNVFVSDEHGRVRAYTSGGGYVSEPIGRYDFTTNKSTGEFVVGPHYISHGFDHLGNAYAMQLGKMYKYIRQGADWSTVWGQPIKAWDSIGYGDAGNPSGMLAVSFKAGVIHVTRATDRVDQYAGSLGTIPAHIMYYIALAAEDVPIRLLALNEEWGIGELNYIAWTGNVWQQLCDLCAATSNAMVAFDNYIFVLNRDSRSFRIPLDANIEPVRFDTRSTGRAIEIVNQRSRYTSGWEILYSAEADDERIFNVEKHSLTYIVVGQNTYPEFLIQPEPSLVVEDGKYVVVDANGLVVDPSRWKNAGGKIRAEIGERPGTIRLTITGPGENIPGRQAPYKIADEGGQVPSLSIIGTGVIADPETYTIGTGITEQVTSRAVAQTIDSPFVFDAETAYSEGAWAAYNSGTPSQRFTITMRPDKTNGWTNSPTGFNGTASFIGLIVTHDDAQYVVETLDYSAREIVLGVYRYTKLGWGTETGVGTEPRPEEIWAGKTAGEFDAYWVEHTAQDFTIAPLRNPFDDPAGYLVDGLFPSDSLLPSDSLFPEEPEYWYDE